MVKKANTAKKPAAAKKAAAPKRAAPAKKTHKAAKSGLTKHLYVIVPTLLLGVAAIVGFSAYAGAQLSSLVVTPKDVSYQQEGTVPAAGYEWVAYSRTPASTATFREGPLEPPYSIGSVELSTPTGDDKVSLLNYSHVGTKLSDINGLRYYTHRTSGDLKQVAAMNLVVDANGPAVAGGTTTLVYEPTYNAASGELYTGTWQSWDAYSGGEAIWWSSQPIAGAPNRDSFVTWKSILANNPDATVVGGFGVNQGSGNPGLVTAVDGLYFSTLDSTTEYDLDFAAPKPFKATAKEQCMNGNYKNFQTVYRNQGDCVSSVVKHEKIVVDPNPGD